MGKKSLHELYKDAWHYMKRKQRKTLELDDLVYMNLLKEIYARIKDNPLYCDDVMMSCMDKYLAEDYSNQIIEDGRVDSLIKCINRTLELNKKVHYLLIPIEGARLSKDIYFLEYSFIFGTEEEIENKIVSITNIPYEKIHSFLVHTKRSRSQDFLKYPMLVMKIDNLNTNVYKNASFTAQKIFQIIKLMIYYLETEEDIVEIMDNCYKDNFHVAIVGEEDWQFGHRNWWNLIQCKYSLDFLNQKEHQDLFETLVKCFIWDKSPDELLERFSNALDLFERSLEQCENYRDITLSLLILFSSAESLLTEGDNEKRLRLSVIWPRVVSISNKTQRDLGMLIKDAYSLRNNFVHAGNMIYDTEKVDLRTLQQMLAKLILKYFQPKEWKGDDGTNEKNNKKWNKYIKEVFDDAIYNYQ